MEYITTKEASAKWGISTTRITILANEGRIPGAQRLGKSWLIPAGATKPTEYKAHHAASKTAETDNFSFPLYHFRPDWSEAKYNQLSAHQKLLFQAEGAVLECQYEEAYLQLEALLQTPDDIVTEIGCLWNAAICCIALNKPDEFTRIYLRLQMLLSKDFPHRDDLVVILKILNTYTETVHSAANDDTCSTDVHEQSLPLTCLQVGYEHLTKEAINPGSADVTLLEINLRFLQSIGAIVVIEMMHCHLLGIYFLRNDSASAEKHAKAVVELAYENKLYFPLVTYYQYFPQVFAPIIAKYPEQFRHYFHTRFSQYEENFSAFLSSLSNEHSVISKFTESDNPYLYAILMGLSNSDIAEKLNVSTQTVKRKLTNICERLGVDTKKEVRDFLQKYL